MRKKEVTDGQGRDAPRKVELRGRRTGRPLSGQVEAPQKRVTDDCGGTDGERRGERPDGTALVWCRLPPTASSPFRPQRRRPPAYLRPPVVVKPPASSLASSPPKLYQGLGCWKEGRG